MEQLNEIFKIIAETLGLSVEFVKANGMEYLLEFGRYKFVSSILPNITIGIIMAFLICFLIVVIYCGAMERKLNVKLNTIVAFIFIIISLSSVANETFKYKSSPAIYSIEKAYKMVNNK